MITCENVCKTYEGTSPVKALKNIQLTIDSNSFTAILGASGSGKSTLMNLIGLIVFPPPFLPFYSATCLLFC